MRFLLRITTLVATVLASLCVIGKGETLRGNSLAASRPRKWRLSDNTSCAPSSIPSDVPSMMPSPSPSDVPSEKPSPSPSAETSQHPTTAAPDLLVQPFSPSDKILVVGTTQIMEEARSLDIPIPSGTQSKDLLDMLSSEGNHGERYCDEFKHPGRWGEPPNESEETTSGHDLAQAVFVREATQDDATGDTIVQVDMGGSSSRHPSWAMLVTLRGANTTHPVRDWASTGADLSNSSVFPNVDGHANDVILLSQSFDDQVNCPRVNKFSTTKEWMQSQAIPNCVGEFENPEGTDMLGYIIKPNEFMDATGFLWGGTLQSSVTANDSDYVWKTQGPGRGGNPGGPSVKDLMVSLTIRPSSSDESGD
ncbi:MAG: hypothetical protein SGARI_004435 [Bacillariaceae sp.]